MKKDPVCGAVVDVRGATAVSRYHDRYYYFCSLWCRDAFEQTPHHFPQGSRGRDPLALELERIALEDDYFVSRKLNPNVDFYSGLIYQAMGFPVTMFSVLFAIPRTSGWLAQWQEMLADPEQKIARPRQLYVGRDQRDYVPMERRG